MWVRVGSFLVREGQTTNLVTVYNEMAIPRVRGQPGNLACLLLEPENKADPFMVVTVWKDRAAAELYESSGSAAEMVSLVRNFYAGPPTLRSFASSSFAGLIH